MVVDPGRIDDPVQFFHDDRLHDSEIERLDWDLVRSRVSLVLDDLYANLRGLPDYPTHREGEKNPATLVFEGVTTFSTDISPADCRRYVHDIEVDHHGDGLRVRILCSPGGIIDMVCASVSIVIEPS